MRTRDASAAEVDLFFAGLLAAGKKNQPLFLNGRKKVSRAEMIESADA